MGLGAPLGKPEKAPEGAPEGATGAARALNHVSDDVNRVRKGGFGLPGGHECDNGELHVDRFEDVEFEEGVKVEEVCEEEDTW